MPIYGIPSINRSNLHSFHPTQTETVGVPQGGITPHAPPCEEGAAPEHSEGAGARRSNPR